MKITDIWLLNYKSRHTECFAILGQFLYFHTSDNLENPNFETLKKFFHMSSLNDNHCMHDFEDMEQNGQNFLSYWTVFCPFTSVGTHKITILEEKKKITGDIIIFHMCIKNDNNMIYGFRDWST